MLLYCPLLASLAQRTGLPVRGAGDVALRSWLVAKGIPVCCVDSCDCFVFSCSSFCNTIHRRYTSLVNGEYCSSSSKLAMAFFRWFSAMLVLMELRVGNSAPEISDRTSARAASSTTPWRSDRDFMPVPVVAGAAACVWASVYPGCQLALSWVRCSGRLEADSAAGVAEVVEKSETSGRCVVPFTVLWLSSRCHSGIVCSANA